MCGCVGDGWWVVVVGQVMWWAGGRVELLKVEFTVVLGLVVGTVMIAVKEERLTVQMSEIYC
jgi:uncharacterized membrane protein (DUF441 family)